ncbi:MAG: hypothetical protein COA96_14360 [SAR86 cluster bacterium]|uniref:C-type lectin domain-containing protein n=1 Tax=SAR86 cluster bacterium TaxID=2030880 RepID=A0A2A5ATJ7_9GAMM|nr:MAG: hypothetical protein COA96_14360 [SAR86 cluster bacterium]
MRRKIKPILSTALALMVSVVMQAEAAPILWDSGTGANGNAYEYIAGTITWDNANTAASGMTYNGATGHLVTLHSTAETNFINPLYSSDPNTTVFGPWIGLNDIVSEGVYVWVTGEAVTYTNWSTGEPNNSGNEDGVHLWGLTSTRPLGTWNDWQVSTNNAGGYIVEFEASEMAPVPTPTALSLLALGLVGLRLSRKKKIA